MIIVEDIDNAEPKRVTGSFRFNAFSEDGLRSVNFIDGVFFKVSLSGGLEALPINYHNFMTTLIGRLRKYKNYILQNLPLIHYK